MKLKWIDTQTYIKYVGSTMARHFYENYSDINLYEPIANLAVL